MGLSIFFGLGLLTLGAELLVRGSSRLARALKLSPLIIGLTVVAFGTSAPELAVSVRAGLAGQSGIALGNVVGSNIFNTLLILGLSALIMPLRVSQQLVRLDVPIMIAVSALAWALATDGTISRLEGMMFLIGIIGYTFLLLRLGKRNTSFPDKSVPAQGSNPLVQGSRHMLMPLVLAIVGLALLVIGARWLVSGAIALARCLGVSELLIGLTLVAGGTSLPELATSLVASIRRERDIAVGNVVGSNIFNILAVLGASATVSGGVNVAPAALHFDVPVMVATALVCLPIFFTGAQIARWEGVLFLAYYAAYLAYLLMAASHHECLQFFSSVMLWFVLPATVFGIGLSLLYATRSRKQA